MLLDNSTVLITGGTGSLGTKLVERLLKTNVKKIIVFARGELGHYNLKRKYPNEKRLRFFIGDVRDISRLKTAMNNVDYVIHASAIKHIDLAEYNPNEAILTNINGAMNVVEASIYCGVKKVVALSTDKAVYPSTLYGVTKAGSDRVFINGNVYSNKTQFSIVRYGNVANSNGSVLPFFKSLIEKGERVLPLTDERMTRFYITLDHAVDLIFNAFELSQGGETFISKLPSYRMTDVVKALGCEYKVVGIRPMEKLDEDMLMTEDSNVYDYDGMYIIYPNQNLITTPNFLGTPIKSFNYNSGNNEHFLTVHELKNILTLLNKDK